MSPHNILPIVLAIPIIEINNVALVSSIFWFEASPRKKVASQEYLCQF